MNKEFVPYDQALELKELGFDEPCLGYYRKDNLTLKFGEGFELVTRNYRRNVMHYTLKNSRYIAGSNAPDGYYYLTTSPTFSQAFRWFKEKHEIFSSVWDFESDKKFFIDWGFGIHTFKVDNFNDTREEHLKLECLKKLIEIVKNK